MHTAFARSAHCQRRRQQVYANDAKISSTGRATAPLSTSACRRVTSFSALRDRPEHSAQDARPRGGQPVVFGRYMAGKLRYEGEPKGTRWNQAERG